MMHRTFLRCLLLLCLGALGPCQAQQLDAGSRIYNQGILSSGASLHASRPGGTELSGQQAACVSCHRPSGMGSVEGNTRIPPISGSFLFPSADHLTIANTDGIRGKSLKYARTVYSDDALRLALGKGVNVQGRQLGELMPRYQLNDDDFLALKAYLAQLSVEPSPGVTKENIRFATVITPDVSQERRAIFLDMLHSVVLAKNSSTSPRKRYMTSAANFITQSERKWDVDVWELTGAPSTWPAQLDALYAKNPVFALLSGLSDGAWEPVDAFCANRHIPCWFPSVKAPPKRAESGFGLYFSSGLVLDARVLANHLQAPGAAKLRRVTQVYMPDTPGADSAGVLRSAWTAAAPQLTNLPVADGGDKKLASLLKDAAPTDALVLWLKPEQLLPRLNAMQPTAATLYIAAPLWADADIAQLPEPWRQRVKIAYPYELPHMRRANLAYLHSWLKLRGLPLVDEVLQSELFFSLNLMTDTLQDMIDNMYRDYLVERTEDNLGKRETSKAEQENRDRQVLGRLGRASVASEAAKGSEISEAADALSAQQRAFGVGVSYGTTVYPRLTLAPGQHFASRGAYVLGVADLGAEPMGDAPVWIVP